MGSCVWPSASSTTSLPPPPPSPVVTLLALDPASDLAGSVGVAPPPPALLVRPEAGLEEPVGLGVALAAAVGVAASEPLLDGPSEDD